MRYFCVVAGFARQPLGRGTSSTRTSSSTRTISERETIGRLSGKDGSQRQLCNHEMSRRDNAIVAWHEAPGTAPPRKSRPVRHGVNRAGGATRFVIGVLE
jgi:hypothetical protein